MQNQFIGKLQPDVVMAHWTRERGLASYITRYGTQLIARVIKTQDVDGIWLYWQPYSHCDYEKLPSWTRPLMRFTKRPNDLAIMYLTLGIFLVALIPYFYEYIGLLTGLFLVIGAVIVVFLAHVARVRLREESVAISWPLEHMASDIGC